MNEEDEKSMVAFSWIVAGGSNMELHAYTEGDDPKNPTIQVLMSNTGMWTFKFKKLAGSGRIQVTKGCDYNPIDLIESLYHHITKQKPYAKNPNNRNPKAKIDYNPEMLFSDIVGFEDEWV